MKNEKGCIKNLFSNGNIFVRSLCKKPKIWQKKDDFKLEKKIKMESIINIINLLRPNFILYQ